MEKLNITKRLEQIKILKGLRKRFLLRVWGLNVLDLRQLKLDNLDARKPNTYKKIANGINIPSTTYSTRSLLREYPRLKMYKKCIEELGITKGKTYNKICGYLEKYEECYIGLCNHEKEWAICQECGEVIEPCDDREEYDGEPLCNDCYENYFARCDECGKVCRQDDELEWVTSADTLICHDCLNDNYTRCDHCGEYYRNDEVTEVEGDYICESCFTDNCCTCDNCGEAMYQANANITRNGIYCSDCYEDMEKVIYSYHNFDSFETIETDNDTGYTIGLEIEVAGDDCFAIDTNDLLNDKAVLMADGSVNGFEIVTHPMMFNALDDFVKNELTKTMKFLDDKGFKGHNHGGIHIHVDKDAIDSPKQLASLVALLYNVEELDTILALTQRKEKELNEWARIDNNDCTPEEILERGIPVAVSNSRYTALNYDGRTETWEFRIFNSSTRTDRIVKNIQIVKSMIEYADITGLDDVSMDNYLNFVFENKNKYNVLADFIVEKGIAENNNINSKVA